MITENELIDLMEPQIQYLSKSFKIAGMEKEDIAQELRMMLVQDYRKFKGNIDLYSEGWWFCRLKWYVQNIADKERKEPVNNSVRIENINNAK